LRGQQVTDEPKREGSVVVHHAGTSTEALIIRGLLESAGIRSPASVSSDPFPLREPPEGMQGTEIVVLESQAEEARRIIADYLDDSEIAGLDGSATPE
jgi:hypothetical protein